MIEVAGFETPLPGNNPGPLFDNLVVGAVGPPDPAGLDPVADAGLDGLVVSPNPSGAAMAVTYRMVQASDVQLEVVDVAGRLIRPLERGRRPRAVDPFRGTGAMAKAIPWGLECTGFGCARMERPRAERSSSTLRSKRVIVSFQPRGSRTFVVSLSRMCCGVERFVRDGWHRDARLGAGVRLHRRRGRRRAPQGRVACVGRLNLASAESGFPADSGSGVGYWYWDYHLKAAPGRPRLFCATGRMDSGCRDVDEKLAGARESEPATAGLVRVQPSPASSVYWVRAQVSGRSTTRSFVLVR